MTAGAYSLLAVVLYHTGDFNQVVNSFCSTVVHLIGPCAEPSLCSILFVHFLYIFIYLGKEGIEVKANSLVFHFRLLFTSKKPWISMRENWDLIIQIQ